MVCDLSYRHLVQIFEELASHDGCRPVGVSEAKE
jgi:hypothetical protein